ncbi:hypothetical protein EVAR_14920_1 [Eumeta japonica]|uniref:Uncharacterized protein n=1 Tax=Eumeta variegata TaxID=151549 RepID=A0A4C1XMY1_EUMVA|nr:hypothetical protein EVAR_14920_1 [Eumeta japonica]
MRSLRSMCRVSPKDRCRDSDVRERCGLKKYVATRVEREQNILAILTLNTSIRRTASKILQEACALLMQCCFHITDPRRCKLLTLAAYNAKPHELSVVQTSLVNAIARFSKIVLRSFALVMLSGIVTVKTRHSVPPPYRPSHIQI